METQIGTEATPAAQSTSRGKTIGAVSAAVLAAGVAVAAIVTTGAPAHSQRNASKQAPIAHETMAQAAAIPTASTTADVKSNANAWTNAASAARGWTPAGVTTTTPATTGAGPETPMTAETPSSLPASYSFKTLDDQADPTFNQLLSVNDEGDIAGYFGSGASPSHPNKGYVLAPPGAQVDHHSENFPGSVQTQVTGINLSDTTVGFYADAAGDNYGFVLRDGVWTVSIDPNTTGTVNQLLGLNNNGLAVGFYTDSKGNAHAYEFNFHLDTFSAINVPGATSTTATGINLAGDISGFYTAANGNTYGFLLAGGHLTTITAPGSTNTMVFGINNSNELVGSYALGKSSYGFVWEAGQLKTVNDPSGIGSTVINGLNDNGEIVGFYTDSKGNTDGFVGMPS
jgi:hypothetical protein